MPIVVAPVANAQRSTRGSPEDPYEWLFLIPAPVSDISKREMIESAAAWSDHLGASGLGAFRASFFDTLLQVDDFIKRRRAEGKPPVFGVIDNMVATKMAKDWGITPILCPVYDGKTTVANIVVVSRSHPAKSLRDLEGQRIAIVKMLAEAPDLLGLTLFGEPVNPGVFFKELVPTQTQKDCLVSLARRQADAALVNKPFFEEVQRRNREAWKEFKTLVELPEQHLAAFVVFNDSPAELVEALRVVALNAKESDAGRHILKLYDVDGFTPCNLETFQEPEGRLIAKLGGGAAKPPPAIAGKASSTGAPPPPVPPARKPDTTEAPSDVPAVDVELDSDTGEVSAVVRFKGAAPSGLRALIALDDGPEQTAALQCAADVCILTLPAERVHGKQSLSLALSIEKGGRTVRLGSSRTYPLRVSARRP